MGGGWYSQPPNYMLIYYKLSDIWPQIFMVGFSEGGWLATQSILPGSAPAVTIIITVNHVDLIIEIQKSLHILKFGNKQVDEGQISAVKR